MRVYFDCEFTHLGEGRKLISVGFVAEDGQELYIELPKNYMIDECSSFTEEFVLPHLNTLTCGLSNPEAAHTIAQWIEKLGSQVTLASDAPKIDYALVLQLLQEHECMPVNLATVPLYIALGNVQQEYESYFERPDAVQHHALWDARALTYAAKIEDDFWKKQ